MKQESGRAYSVLVNDVRRQLHAGELRVGDRLPSEAELRDAYGISINSVRRGIEDFVRRGILIRRRGSGTYVQTIPEDIGYDAAPARRDTIGVYCDCWYASYHPYYTELHRGMRERLQELGWLLDWPVHERRMLSWEHTDVLFEGPSGEQLALQLARRRNLAGVIVTANYAATIATRAPELTFPIVTTALHPTLPSAGYDWDEELLTAMRLVLRAGSRRPLVVSGMDNDAVRALASRAAVMEGLSGEAPQAVACTTRIGGQLYSEVVHAAHEATRESLAADNSYDGLVAASDYHAQGAFDALTRSGNRSPMPIVTLMNQESRLPTRFPYTALVANGRTLGRATAELLHEHITTPETAPRRRTLRCEIREI